MARIIYLMLFFIILTASASTQDFNYLFKAGDNGYKCFRIPAVIKTQKGSILAFAEGRKNHCGDADDIDLVVRRSEDGGNTWSPMAELDLICDCSKDEIRKKIITTMDNAFLSSQMPAIFSK